MSNTSKKVNIELEVDTNIVNSGTNPYQKVIWLARAFDSWRIFPRAFIVTYIYLLIEVVTWFMNLSDPNNAQAGLVSVVVGAGAAWFGLYVNSRGDGKETKETFAMPAQQVNTISAESTVQRTPVAPSRLPDL